jgi:hypothetical protein
MKRNITATKICHTCQIEKPITAFSLNGRDGYRNRRCKPCVITNFNGDKKTCKACDIEKPINEFPSSNTYGVKASRCRLCITNKILIPTEKKSFNKKKDTSMPRLGNITKETYKEMYIFLRDVLGYDLNSNLSIHEQFCLKHNLSPNNPENTFENHFSIEECFK